MSDLTGRVTQFLIARRTLYVAAWLLAFALAVGRYINAYYCFKDKHPPGDPNRRADGNDGHVTIDFGGQWMMGRMLATGHGRELYSRPRQWEVAQKAYPREHESLTEKDHDPKKLIRHFMGQEDARWFDVGGHIGASTAIASNPFANAAAVISFRSEWSDDQLHALTHPIQGDGVGGPLYPPIHAFLMWPFATGDHPHRAYVAMRCLQIMLCFVAGLGINRLSQGRFWWPMASSLILVYPGSRGVIDLSQNSAFTLSLLIWGWVCLSRNRPLLGGILWGLLAYKPVWAMSFFLMLVLIRQWRMALAMGLTGAAIALATVPVVGINAWRQWLAVGQDAARIYNVDKNWVHLSRDLLGVPRRFLIDFDIAERLDRDNLVATVASWGLWAFVLEVSLRVYSLRCKRPLPFTGPLPAMLILTTWMCTYHFMYYDSLISVFGVSVLLADPRPFFRPRALNRVGDIPDIFGRTNQSSHEKRSQWLANSFVLTVVVLMVCHENSTQILDFEATYIVGAKTSKRMLEDSTTEPAPRLVLGTGDRYPWDTMMIIALWGWCCAVVVAGKWKAGEREST